MITNKSRVDMGLLHRAAVVLGMTEAALLMMNDIEPGMIAGGADTYNILKDVVADPLSIREFLVDSGVAIEIGDLCWMDKPTPVAPTATYSVKPASSTDLWTGSLAGTQGKLAEKFVGVALSKKVSTDTVTNKVRVACRAVVRMTCVSAAFEIGDHVCGSRDASNNYLLAKTVEKVTGTNPLTGNPNESMAIGRVSKREASAVTIVEFEIMGRSVAGGGVRAFLTS